MFGGLNERALKPRRAGRHCRRGLPASRAGKIRCILNKIKQDRVCALVEDRFAKENEVLLRQVAQKRWETRGAGKARFQKMRRRAKIA